ncbi:MAG: DUF2059 domain-containing protein [Myxococcaceae bacterium]
MRSLVVAVLVLFSVPAVADEASARAAAAHEVAKLALTADQWALMVANGTKDAEAAFAQMMPDNKGLSMLMPVLREEMNALYPTYEEMLDLQTSLFAKYYTVDELRKLKAFYGTALGKKSLAIQPELSRDVNGFMNERIQRAMPQIMAKVFARVSEGAPDAEPDAEPEPVKPVPAGAKSKALKK